MRHQHVTVTLEAETVEQIEAELDSGETVSAWIADAARGRLQTDEESESREDRPLYEFVDDCAI